MSDCISDLQRRVVFRRSVPAQIIILLEWLEMILSLLLLSFGDTVLVSVGFLWINVEHHENEHQNEVENQHADSPSEAIDISASDAFAEEDTMVVVVINAHVAVFTVLHILGHVHVALHAVQNLVSVPIRVFSYFVLRLVMPRCLCLLESLLADL